MHFRTLYNIFFHLVIFCPFCPKIKAQLLNFQRYQPEGDLPTDLSWLYDPENLNCFLHLLEYSNFKLFNYVQSIFPVWINTYGRNVQDRMLSKKLTAVDFGKYSTHHINVVFLPEFLSSQYSPFYPEEKEMKHMKLVRSRAFLSYLLHSEYKQLELEGRDYSRWKMTDFPHSLTRVHLECRFTIFFLKKWDGPIDPIKFVYRLHAYYTFQPIYLFSFSHYNKNNNNNNNNNNSSKNNNPRESQTEGWPIVYNPYNKRTIRSIVCYHGESCYPKMHNAFLKLRKGLRGRRVVVNFAGIYNPEEKIEMGSLKSPFRRLKSGGRSTTRSLYDYLLHPLNATAVVCDHDPMTCPHTSVKFIVEKLESQTTYWKEKVQYAFFLTSSTDYRFITTDKVKQLKTSFELYIKPFEVDAWIAIAVSSGVTALFFALLPLFLNLENEEDGDKRFWRKKVQETCSIFLETLVWLKRLVVEQCTDYPTAISKLGGDSDEGPILRVCCLIFGIWTLFSVVLINGYKGIIKSDYALAYPYFTEWRYVREFIQDDLKFQIFYMAYEDSCFGEHLLGEENNIFGMTVNILWGVPFYSRVAEFMEPAVQKCRAICPRWNTKFEDSSCSHLDPCIEANQIIGLLNRTISMCTNHFMWYVKHKWVKKKTVLIVPKKDLEFYWVILRFFTRDKRAKEIKSGLLKVETSLKFAHSGHMTSDDSFIRMNGFLIHRSFPLYKPHFLEKRGEKLLSSGIYGLWEEHLFRQSELPYKEHLFKKAIRNSNISLLQYLEQENLPEFTQLSFRNSSVGLIFYGLLFLLSLGLVYFIVEKSVSVLIQSGLVLVNRIQRLYVNS